MKINLFACIIGILALVVVIPSSAFAGPRQPVSTDNPEPHRIYDIASRNFIDNPDYREPARTKRTAKPRGRTAEPRRVYNPMTRQFEDDPNVRAPASVRERGRSGPGSSRKRSSSPSETGTRSR
jgi:hypothetical protein